MQSLGAAAVEHPAVILQLGTWYIHCFQASTLSWILSWILSTNPHCICCHVCTLPAVGGAALQSSGTAAVQYTAVILQLGTWHLHCFQACNVLPKWRCFCTWAALWQHCTGCIALHSCWYGWYVQLGMHSCCNCASYVLTSVSHLAFCSICTIAVQPFQLVVASMDHFVWQSAGHADADDDENKWSSFNRSHSMYEDQICLTYTEASALALLALHTVSMVVCKHYLSAFIICASCESVWTWQSHFQCFLLSSLAHAVIDSHCNCGCRLAVTKHFLMLSPARVLADACAAGLSNDETQNRCWEPSMPQHVRTPFCHYPWGQCCCSHHDAYSYVNLSILGSRSCLQSHTSLSCVNSASSCLYPHWAACIGTKWQQWDAELLCLPAELMRGALEQHLRSAQICALSSAMPWPPCACRTAKLSR